MAAVTCVDGCVLAIGAVPVLDRDGVPYEVTLSLTLDGQPFGEVGERCGYFLASTAGRLRAARAAGGPEAFPASSAEAGVRALAVDEGLDPDATWTLLQRYLPRDRELFAFGSRDPDDLARAGELRVTLSVERSWTSAGWVTRPRAVLQAWGEGGRGVRAGLDSTGLLALLEELVAGFAAVGASYDEDEDAAGLRRPVG